MISLFRSPRIGQLKISSPSLFLHAPPPPSALLRSYHAGRASSVNTAIQRGLRKSKGIGFRGPRNTRPDDPREIYRARTGLHPDDFATAKADSTASRKEARSGAQNDRLTRSNSRSLRGRTGVKDRGASSSGRPIRSEAILRSEESGDSEIRGRFGEKLTPRIRKFEHEGSRSGRGTYREGSYNPPSTSRFETGHDAHTYDRSSRPYHLGSQDAASKDAYPSLSFRERSPGSRTPESYESRYSGRDRPLTGSYTPEKFGARSPDRFAPRASERNVRLGNNKSLGRTSDTFESRTPGRIRESMEGHFIGGTVGKHGRGSSERSVNMSHRENTVAGQPYGKRHESHSSSTPQVSQVFDKHLPLSIPYTTPASEFLYGTSVVEAAITSRRSPKRKLYKLYIYTGENREDAERDSRLERLARKNGIQVVRVGSEWIRLMDKMSSGRPHNGYILEASPLPRLPVTHLGKFRSDDSQEGFEVSVDHQSREEAAVNGTGNFIQTIKCPSGRKPLVLLLDSIVDPGNLGGIIRTASFLGVSAIAIAARNSASFTPVVLKASAGASENITLFSVKKPAGFIVDSKTAGWRVYAAVAPSKRNDPSLSASLSTDDLADPLSHAPSILMLGSEGEGLRWNLRSKADVDLYIQGSGQSFNVDSLNVSVATGILCNAFLSKKDGKAAVPVTNESPTEDGLRKNSVPSASALF
ncbi:RNA methyltransferase [Cadophora sp. DSE1049]|nr:RNA methyltransferase [Cadophora sp. DSE1049]